VIVNALATIGILWLWALSLLFAVAKSTRALMEENKHLKEIASALLRELKKEKP